MSELNQLPRYNLLYDDTYRKGSSVQRDDSTGEFMRYSDVAEFVHEKLQDKDNDKAIVAVNTMAFDQLEQLRERLIAVEHFDAPAWSLLREWLLASDDFDLEKWIKDVRDLIEDSDDPPRSYDTPRS